MCAANLEASGRERTDTNRHHKRNFGQVAGIVTANSVLEPNDKLVDAIEVDSHDGALLLSGSAPNCVVM